MTESNHAGAVHLKWRDQQRIDWQINPLPFADKFGWHRGHYDRLEGTNFGASLVVLPFGQASPPHASRKEHIILVLEGEVAFAVGPDQEEYNLERYDALFIPAEIVYEYWNVSQGNALFYSITGHVSRSTEGPTYFLPGAEAPTAFDDQD